MDTHLLAYLAGVVDSDGYVMIYRKLGPTRRDGQRPMYYMIKMGLNQVAPIIPNLFRDTFGGAVYCYEHAGRQGLPWFMWSSWSNDAAKALQHLLPYLRLKAEQAEIGIRFDALISLQSQRAERSLITAEMEAERADLYGQIRHLNRPRNPIYAGELMPLPPIEEVSA